MCLLYRIKSHSISYTFVVDEFMPNPNADFHAHTSSYISHSTITNNSAKDRNSNNNRPYKK